MSSNKAQHLPEKPTPVLTLHFKVINQHLRTLPGPRDQILGVETHKMNLSGILPSVTSCGKVKINIQLLLAIIKRSSKNSEKIALVKLSILEFLT